MHCILAVVVFSLNFYFLTGYNGSKLECKLGFMESQKAEIHHFLLRKKSENPNLRIIDVGGSASTFHDIVDVLVDARETNLPNTSNIKVQFQLDLIDPDTWGPVLQYVEENGKFDYSICSHTLEDILHPALAAKLLVKISKQGFVAFPSMYEELSYHTPMHSRGHSHHHWIFTVKRQTLVAYPKLPLIEHKVFDVVASYNYLINGLMCGWTDALKIDYPITAHLFYTSFDYMAKYLELLEPDDVPLPDDIDNGFISYSIYDGNHSNPFDLVLARK